MFLVNTEIVLSHHLMGIKNILFLSHCKLYIKLRQIDFKSVGAKCNQKCESVHAVSGFFFVCRRICDLFFELHREAGYSLDFLGSFSDSLCHKLGYASIS
jgi:hypothetical protein